MGKKKTDEAGVSGKAKGSSKDSKEGKKEKLSVSAMLANMDQKLEKPNKGSLATGASKAKPKAASKASTYIDGIDLPLSDDEEEEYVPRSEEVEEQMNVHRRYGRNEAGPIDTSISYKELKKREKKDMLAVQAAEVAKKEALRDDRDAFTVVIGSRVSVL